MPDDEERNEGEELFEDLDKFFAPIQDVDWPEGAPTRPAEPAPAPPAAAPPEREPEPEPAPEPVVEPFEEEVSEEALPAAPAPWEAEATREEEQATDAGVGSFLFEAEAEEYEGLEGEAVRIEAVPAGQAGGEDEGVAELIEEAEPAIEEAPDLEAVEAAAEHFAGSIREETGLEGEAPVAPATEEIAIAQLLGEEGEGAPGEPEGARAVRVGAEGLGGPSWQEPTALEVGAEQEGRGPREMPTRFLTGIVLAGLAIGAILLGEGAFAIFAGLVVLFAQGELYLALQKHHFQPATALGLVAGALILGAGYYRGEGAMLAVTALATFATFLWYMTVPPQHRRNIVSNVALTVLGIAYIPLLAAYALAVLKLPDGQGLAVAIIGLTFVYDTAAFGVGYFWGSRPLAPNVSPKKSWEGAIGATLVTIAVAVGVVAPSVTLLDTVGRSVGLALVVAIFAPLGDLAESLLKRDLGIKDMGGVLPGHGGVLDRIDSVLFVAPAAFLYLRLILL
ncbi:MAG TPA: phosphatidate cytidylyltransferase [Actinomycetota bacterium]|nr:phosphatidate cytidylyltransferase [Actinomycetota bacterium]